MRQNLLLPRVYRIIGIIMVIPGVILGYLFTYHDYVIPFLAYGTGPSKDQPCGDWWTGKHNLTDELIITLLIVGCFFIAFSRLKNESNVTIRLRVQALYWAVLVNSCLIFINFFLYFFGEIFHINFTFNPDMFDMEIYSSVLIFWLIFIVRFLYLLYRDKQGKPIGLLKLLPYKPYYMIGAVLSFIFIIVLILIPAIWKIGFPANVFMWCSPVFLLWIWSEEKNETTDITDIRMKSMQIAVYINFGLLLLETWAIYGADYWAVLLSTVISVPIIFSIVFYYLRHKHHLAKTGMVGLNH